MGSSEKSTEYRLVGDSRILERLRIQTSLDDIRSAYFWRAVFAELLGSLILVLVGCGSCLPGVTIGPDVKVDPNAEAMTIRISLTFGLTVGTIVWSIAHISGGHINPAVTLAMLVTRNVSLVRGLLYIIAQLAGAAAGGGILFGLVPADRRSGFGVTQPNGVTELQAVGVELMITFILVFVIFATVDGKRDDLNGSGPLSIGLSVAMCHLAFVPFTGSSMNPARSFGPAVISANTGYLWIYWVGPCLGGLIAGILYDSLFAANASLNRAKALLLASKYDGGEFVSMKNAEKIGIVERIEINKDATVEITE